MRKSWKNRWKNYAHRSEATGIYCKCTFFCANIYFALGALCQQSIIRWNGALEGTAFSAFDVHFINQKVYGLNIEIIKRRKITTERISSEKLYSKIELDEAYINGLECAVVVLEQAIDLNYRDQTLMIECLKEVVLKHKTRAVIEQMQFKDKEISFL